MKNYWSWSCIILLATAIFCTTYNNEESLAVETERLQGVYLLSGYNIHSYEPGEKGQMRWTGIAHDYAVLGNPTEFGDEFVAHEYTSGGETRTVYFYRDNLVKAEVPVYIVKTNATCYVDGDGLQLQAVPEQEKWWENDRYLIGPSIDPNGGNRVYVDGSSGFHVPYDKVKRFFYRSDLTLLNPQDIN